MDWSQVLKTALEEARKYWYQYSEPLTLRGLFYILVSKNVIPNTKSAYKRLSAVLAKARYRGEFPWYYLKDVTRKVQYLEPWTYYPTKPLSEEEILKIIEDYVNNHFDVSINPWDDQPKRVIVVVEKEALGDLVAAFVKEVFKHGVYQVRVIKGYDSATDVKKVAEDVESIDSRGKIPVVLQLGDYDPSGEDIVRDFRERVKMLSNVENIVFEKVAVTADQILELNLPPKPESADEIAKLKRDPRYPKYVEKLKRDPKLRPLVEQYGGLVRVELDALVALRPEDFKKILRKAIEKHFDWNIYNNVTKRKKEELGKKAEEFKKQTMENLKKLLKKQGE
ncbi:MAG: hypothetical protein NDF55_10495 [archaeon GB-1867-005]|nr:hypothetical protein [Candidatus Culexmicrobium cathedralense]